MTKDCPTIEHDLTAENLDRSDHDNEQKEALVRIRELDELQVKVSRWWRCAAVVVTGVALILAVIRAELVIAFLAGLISGSGLVYLSQYGKLAYLSESRCRKCGYILRGLSEPRCPECGTRL